MPITPSWRQVRMQMPIKKQKCQRKKLILHVTLITLRQQMREKAKMKAETLKMSTISRSNKLNAMIKVKKLHKMCRLLHHPPVPHIKNLPAEEDNRARREMLRISNKDKAKKEGVK